MHSFVKHDIVVKTECTTVAAPELSVTLVDENIVVSDSLVCLDLMAFVIATCKYERCRVITMIFNARI